MNKKELIDIVSKKAGESKGHTKFLLNLFLEEITTTVAAGGSVNIHKFGSFDSRFVKERELNTPFMNGPQTLPAKNIPKFTPYKNFSDLVNNSFLERSKKTKIPKKKAKN